MTITFFGHSDYKATNYHREKMIQVLLRLCFGEKVFFYLGGYGAFDEFSYNCCREIKMKYPKTELIFITPYITEHYQKNHLRCLKEKYDGIVYPEIENVPLRYAISARNKWMVEKSDLVIAYVNHSWGGAFSACRVAKAKGKKIINIGTYDFK